MFNPFNYFSNKKQAEKLKNTQTIGSQSQGFTHNTSPAYASTINNANFGSYGGPTAQKDEDEKLELVKKQKEKLKILLDDIKEVLAELAGEELQDFETIFKLYEGPVSNELTAAEMVTVNELYRKYKTRKENEAMISAGHPNDGLLPTDSDVDDDPTLEDDSCSTQTLTTSKNSYNI